MAETDARMAENQREILEMKRQDLEIRREISERFARIEALLLEHSRILAELPEAIRAKMGFRPS